MLKIKCKKLINDYVNCNKFVGGMLMDLKYSVPWCKQSNFRVKFSQFSATVLAGMFFW